MFDLSPYPAQIGLPTNLDGLALGFLLLYLIIALCGLATLCVFFFSVGKVARLPRRQRNGILILFSIVCVISIAGASHWIFRSSEPKFVPVEVWFLRPVSQIKGYHWPLYKKEPSEMVAVEQPSILKLHFPNGKVFQTKTKLIEMVREGRSVNHVIVLPLLNPVSFHAALEECKIVLTLLEIKPTDNAWNVIRDLQAVGVPGDSSLSSEEVVAAEDINKSAALYLEIKQTWGTSPDGDNWFVSVDFYGYTYKKLLKASR